MMNQHVRTDLAVEAREMYVKEHKQDIEGVRISDTTEKGIKISTIHIDDEAANKINKKTGTYITIHTKAIKQSDANKQLVTAKIVSKQ